MLSVTLLLIVVLYVYRADVVRYRTTVNFILQQVPTILKALEEYQLQLTKHGADPHTIDKVDFVQKEIEQLATACNIVLNDNVRDIADLLLRTFPSAADLKKEATENLYAILTHTHLPEDQAYHLTYIFNRFIGELLKNPQRALLDLCYRFYVFLKNFGYLHLR